MGEDQESQAREVLARGFLDPFARAEIGAGIPGIMVSVETAVAAMLAFADAAPTKQPEPATVPVDAPLEAARTVVDLANNEGVATGNGAVIWEAAVRDLQAALTAAQTAPIQLDREAIIAAVEPLYRGQRVAGGDGDTYIASTPTGQIADAIIALIQRTDREDG